MTAKKTKKKRTKKEEIEETLPLTEGDGSIYRKDEETGKINLEKVVTGAVGAAQKFKITKPALEGVDYKQFISTLKELAIAIESFDDDKATYNEKEIDEVNKGGLVGNIANKIIKDKYGESANK